MKVEIPERWKFQYAKSQTGHRLSLNRLIVTLIDEIAALEQSLRDTIHEDSKAQGEDRRTIDEQAAEIARLREQVRAHSLESARNYLHDYYESHSMGVNAVIQSQWARGVHSGRKECLNILDEAIDNQYRALAATEPRP